MHPPSGKYALRYGTSGSQRTCPDPRSTRAQAETMRARSRSGRPASRRFASPVDAEAGTGRRLRGRWRTAATACAELERASVRWDTFDSPPGLAPRGPRSAVASGKVRQQAVRFLPHHLVAFAAQLLEQRTV